VYDNATNFKMNLGAAWQSAAHYDFSINAIDVPLFEWPTQLQGGMTFYFLEGLPLRVTVDAQLILWSEAVRKSLLPGISSFRDITNYSLGAEYVIKASDKIRLYPGPASGSSMRRGRASRSAAVGVQRLASRLREDRS
jgi:hypothetical protein